MCMASIWEKFLHNSKLGDIRLKDRKGVDSIERSMVPVWENIKHTKFSDTLG